MINIKLTKRQWERFSDIVGNLSVLMVASVVIPFLYDVPNIPVVVLGVTFAIILCYYSIWLARKS